MVTSLALMIYFVLKLVVVLVMVKATPLHREWCLLY